MALGGKINHPIGLVPFERATKRRSVTDVDTFEGVTGMSGCLWDGGKICGISQFIDIDHSRVRLIQQVADDRGADEARPSRYQDCLSAPSQHQPRSPRLCRHGGTPWSDSTAHSVGTGQSIQDNCWRPYNSWNPCTKC